MQKAVFHDEKLENQFLKQGYVVANFIGPETLGHLHTFYQIHAPSGIEGFHTTHFSKDFTYKKKIHDGITQILWPELQKHFLSQSPIFSNFMVKEGGGNNPMPLHADWTYVEEPEEVSISVWIPLVDTCAENGCLGVIPFSHHLSHSIRGPRILQWEAPCGELLIKNMGELLPIKAGQAVIYNHRLLHYSPPNDSDSVRPAINISMVPDGAAVIHYTYPEGETHIHKYAVSDPDFFIRYNNFQIPEMGKPIEYIDKDAVPRLNDRVEDFLKKYKSNIFTKALSFFKRQ